LLQSSLYRFVTSQNLSGGLLGCLPLAPLGLLHALFSLSHRLCFESARSSRLGDGIFSLSPFAHFGFLGLGHLNLEPSHLIHMKPLLSLRFLYFVPCLRLETPRVCLETPRVCLNILRPRRCASCLIASLDYFGLGCFSLRN
jgi:hypothetical protein